MLPEAVRTSESVRGTFAGVASAVMIITVAVPATAAQTEESPAVHTELRPPRAGTAPIIDGTLDDAVWQGPPLELGEWQSYNPLHGERIPQQTRVWIAYDSRYLYFAFQCDDPDPSGIKTSISRRDRIFSDDWVGLSLDALGTGQLAYHMMVNPSGIQLDMLNTSGGGEDVSPDWIWDSAGRVHEGGYTVEIRLPLQSIRFKGGDEVRMGVLFWRRVSRTGISVSWPALSPGRWVFEHHAPLVFNDLRAVPPREVIPSATFGVQQSRRNPSSWNGAEGNPDLGLSAKVGLNSTITLDATINPDFSQVESDAFQVEVNQRFPVFFSEKRPFFMEGAGLFNMAGVGDDSSMITTVHTRRIVDPLAGVKLTGSTGRLTFATLSAVDQGPGRLVPAGEPGSSQNKLFNLIRTRYSVGGSNYVGTLVTLTDFASGYNRAAGADAMWRPSGSQRLSGMVLWSTTRATDGSRITRGAAGQVNYGYSYRRLLDLAGQVEHYDRDFQMDTAFYQRTGFTSGWAYAGLSLYPDRHRYPWFRRVVPFTFTQGGRDRMAGADDFLNVTGVRMHFTRQGFFRFDQLRGREAWAGRRYDLGRSRIFGQVQLFRWLNVFSHVNFGGAVFYDPIEPFQGRSTTYRLNVTLQPSERFNQEVGYQRVEFDRAATGVRVFDLNILNSRTTYQFSRHVFVRGTAQYDGSHRRILTDLLGSYELRPGTVFFAGYGSLLERRDWRNEEWVLREGRYLVTRRGLFLKASYLHRF
jgi:hypothetical protein